MAGVRVSPEELSWSSRLAGGGALRRVDLGEIEYRHAVHDMAGWVEQRRAGTEGDRLFLLSHPDVITCGPRTDLADLPDEMAGLPGGSPAWSGCGRRTAARWPPSACGSPPASVRELAAERGLPVPTDAEVRDAVAGALGAE